MAVSRLLFYCCLFFIGGVFVFSTMFPPLNKKEGDFSGFVEILGRVAKEPVVKENSKQFVLVSENLKVLVFADRYSDFQYGDRLKIRGTLKTPPQFEGFNYKEFLAKDGVYYLMAFPDIEFLDRGGGNKIIKIILGFKNKFEESIKKYLSPPQSGFALALTLGEESDFSQVWKSKLNITGTRHIAAVSGMNITIISFLIFSFMMSLGFWRRQAFYMSIFLLAVYILMIGAPSSALRAGIMGGLFMAAEYFGRQKSAGRAVVFAATIMLFQNPFLLRFDVGFQLSFLAILGIIYLQPIIFKWLKIIPNPWFLPARTTLSATFAAQIFTAPILIYNFGNISLVSPATNLIIVPFLASITILVFLFGLLGIVFPPLAFLLLGFVWLPLTYIVVLVDFFSKLPFASLALKNASWVWVALSYLVLGLLTRKIKNYSTS